MFLRKLLLVFFTGITSCVMAQTNNNYTASWKKVEDLEKKGLTAAAKKEVTAIYKLAQKDNNDAQQIKACMYLVKYRSAVEEDSRELNIFYVDTLIAGAKAPAKNILQSMQAEMFWQYLQNNRWKLYDRTALKEEKSKDISTWSTDKLHSTISKLYKASLQNDALLKTTRLDGFDAIIVKGVNTRQLRPTLFDFLAHRALDYFMTDENNITAPAYAFQIDNEKAFAPAAEFVKASFKTKDTASLQHKAILLLQEIISFHLNDAKPGALLDADLIRLSFVQEHATMQDKEKQYESALKEIEEKYISNETAAQAMYLRAKIYYGRGQQFEPYTKTAYQYELKRAKELCELAVNKFPKSEGGINAQNLISSITQPALSIESEMVNTVNEPFRTLVTYKNAPKVYFRIIKTNLDEIKKTERRDDDKRWAAYVAMKPAKSWSIALPDLKDFQTHRTEIKTEGLDNGVYFLLASTDENFSLQKNIIAKQTLYVSNISYIHNGNNEYYVLHRDSGLPLAAAQVQLWESKYNYQTGNDNDIKAEKYTTDQNGMFKLKPSKEYRDFLLQVQYKNDELFMYDREGYNTYNGYETPVKPVTFLFTDRSIYRPGQTVYFKGIVIKNEKDAGKSAVVPGFITKVILRDANYQKVTDIKLISNEYGSYNGSFKLPEGTLNGYFSIYDSITNGYMQLSVEEYKRPKFFVEVAKPKGSYRVNDSIKVTGTAKAYAGNNVDGAKVKYRVTRRVQFPVWWGWSYGRGKIGWPYGNNGEMEISNGELTTNAAGEFNITFKAIPDENADKKDQPTFYYEVSADVTDINGETRSSSTDVAVAYQALQLDIEAPEKMPADSLKKLAVTSANSNGIFEKAMVTLGIHKVKSPATIYRTRYWDMPDQFVMSKEEFSSSFPYDVYKDEDQMNTWPLGDRMLEKTDSTKESGNWELGMKNWEAGWYKIVALAKDKYGEDVRAEKYIQLTGNNSPVAEAITVDVIKSKAVPGEQIRYNVNTGFDNIWAIHAISKMNSLPQTIYQTLVKGQSAASVIPAGEQDRGGMSASIAFVKHNRVYMAAEDFAIPWTNKDLKISFETFRDKVLPGSNEKYTVKISGSKGEKVAAEMLAAMYDASLDQFKPHGWNTLDIWPLLYNSANWEKNGFEKVESEEYNKMEDDVNIEIEKSYDRLGVRKMSGIGEDSWWLGSLYEYGVISNRMVRGAVSYAMSVPSAAAMNKVKFTPPKIVADKEVVGNITAVADTLAFNMTTGGKDINNKNEGLNTPVQIRKNFNETAFFYPELRTDANGSISFSATLPEALTQWKLMTLAHTKDLASGSAVQIITTQKPLMVQPNAPRFLREGDKMEFSAKVVNMSDSEITGTAQLELLDATTNNPIDGWFKNMFPTQYFTVAAGQSAAVKFPMEVPFNFNSAMSYRIIAKTANASDGEEMALPVLTNRTLVTESLPVNMRGTGSKQFKFEKLLNSGSSNTLSTHALTVEYTSNPAWYAVQALPYLMEFPYECAEQTFNRYYANTLAAFISNSTPRIKAVFEKWKTIDTAALQSNLEKNQELKSALLEETPWVLDAQNENQQKKNIALLFDMVKMGAEQTKALTKLKEMQSPNGGFVWFTGGPDDRYITQYIITGIGHLLKMKAISNDDKAIMNMAAQALPYLDKKIKEDYDWLIKNKVKRSQDNLSNISIQYLYMRSFFPGTKIAAASQTAVNYYSAQAKKYWLQHSKYEQAMIALALQRGNDAVTPKAIIRSLKENAIVKEETGMYWKEWTTGGYYWYQAPIESQAMMVEAFSDIDKDNTTVDDLKTWLLKQKQTQNWKTTRATAEACYALLLNGNNWLAEEKEITVQLGNTVIKSSGNSAEAGAGYFKQKIEGKNVKPAMGNITVTISTPKPINPSTSWGAVYWQYFEDLDKITAAATPLQLKKQLFVERNSDKGPVLEALADGAPLKVGDKIKVRIELKADRDMEYVHMKDLRAACMEPVNVLSGYQWQGGLGYYESTKDASTNFFFNWLPRGTYIFEYSLFVTHAGDFSNGITSIQCMYAPEFTAHSEGIRVSVEE